MLNTYELYIHQVINTTSTLHYLARHRVMVRFDARHPAMAYRQSLRYQVSTLLHLLSQLHLDDRHFDAPIIQKLSSILTDVASTINTPLIQAIDCTLLSSFYLTMKEANSLIRQHVKDSHPYPKTGDSPRIRQNEWDREHTENVNDGWN
jgi:hypothetical protein